MKELSIVKQMVADGQISQEVAEKYFLQLKESEDERVRKELISFIRRQIECHDKPNVERDEKFESWIAWLEKQGEHANFRYKIQVGDKVTRNKDGMLVNLSQLNRLAKPTNEEQKDILEDAILDGNEDGLIAETIRYKKEKQGEKKPADKVEPKFHEGDWLIYENGSIYYVNKVYEHTYELVIDNGDKPRIPHELIDKKARLWTIQDAKDGDVLVVDNITFIYKRTLANHIVSYCKLINNGFFEPFDDARTCCEGNIYIHPPTKEQRDTLFARMKESGYEWDAEKKELKKIEQKSIWCEEDDRILIEMLRIFGIENFEGYNIGENNEDALKFLKSIKDRVQLQNK